MTEPAHQPSSLLRDTNLHVIFAVTLMAILGVTTVTPAFPQIAAALQISPQSVGLLIAVFTLPGVVLTPVLGVLADRWGRKAVLVPSLFLFAVAGAACGFAPTFEALLVLRFIQGGSAAALGAINITILGDLYSGLQRTTALGYNASVLSIGTSIYPVVGGALAALGWQVPFFLPVLAIPVGLLVLFVLQAPEPKTSGDFRTYLANALRVMKNREVIALFGASIVTFVLIYGPYLTFFPFVLEGRFGASAFTIGLVMSATSVATAFTAFQLGRLARRFGERSLVKVAYLLYALAMVSIPFTTSFGTLVVPIVLFGIGNAIAIPTSLAVLNQLAPAQYRAAIISMNGTVLRLGQTLGPLVVGGVVDFVGLDGGFFASAALALVMLAVLAMLLVGPDASEV